MFSIVISGITTPTPTETDWLYIYVDLLQLDAEVDVDTWYKLESKTSGWSQVCMVCENLAMFAEDSGMMFSLFRTYEWCCNASMWLSTFSNLVRGCLLFWWVIIPLCGKFSGYFILIDWGWSYTVPEVIRADTSVGGRFPVFSADCSYPRSSCILFFRKFM